MTTWLPDPQTEPEIFINNFVMHAVLTNPASLHNLTEQPVPEETVSLIIAEQIRHHFRAGYCWHFANILKSVFNRGKICWTAPFSHFVWLDDNGIAYDIEGQYNGEAYQLIPAEYLENFIECFKHVTPEKDKDTAPYSKDILIQIIKKYCHDVNITYDPDIERYYFDDNNEAMIKND